MVDPTHRFEALAVGDPAPAIDLPAHGGSRWRLADNAGRPVD